MIDFYRRLLQASSGMGWLASGAIAAGAFVVTTATAVAVVVWMPADHFSRSADEGTLARRHPALRWTLLILKNGLGLLIVPLGVLMALPLVPGPGLVFILVGLSLLDFPGKRSLERRLLRVPAVLRFLNRVRGHFSRPPLVI